jgi:PPOX class probable F420-dependent enzyme
VVPDAWHRLATGRVARLATVGGAAEPHLVPCCFALDGLRAYSVVDDKPKRTTWLQRLADVAERPVATLLVDHYDEDWRQLWWVRAGGPARIAEAATEPPAHRRATALLLAKYPQYVAHTLEGPVLIVELVRWRSWSAGGRGA